LLLLRYRFRVSPRRALLERESATFSLHVHPSPTLLVSLNLPNPKELPIHSREEASYLLAAHYPRMPLVSYHVGFFVSLRAVAEVGDDVCVDEKAFNRWNIFRSCTIE
jgi:hypothetical protein